MCLSVLIPTPRGAVDIYCEVASRHLALWPGTSVQQHLQASIKAGDSRDILHMHADSNVPVHIRSHEVFAGSCLPGR